MGRRGASDHEEYAFVCLSSRHCICGYAMPNGYWNIYHRKNNLYVKCLWQDVQISYFSVSCEPIGSV